MSDDGERYHGSRNEPIIFNCENLKTIGQALVGVVAVWGGAIFLVWCFAILYECFIVVFLGALWLLPLILYGFSKIYGVNRRLVPNLMRDALFIVDVGKIKWKLDRKLKRRGGYTTADFFAEALLRSPGVDCLVFQPDEGEAVSLSFNDVDLASNCVANWALSRGVICGDTVALLMHNQLEYVVVWLGLAKIGAATAFVNPALRGDALLHSVALCNARLVLFDSSLLELILELEEKAVSAGGSVNPANKGGFVCVNVCSLAPNPGSDSDSGPIRSSSHESLNLWDGSESETAIDKRHRSTAGITDTLFHIFTSGTTGLPKAARINHLRFFAGGLAMGTFFKVTGDDRIYCPLPLCHSSATIIGVGVSWLASAPFIFRRRFSARRFWLDARENNASIVMYIGELCRYLLAAPRPPRGDTSDTDHGVRLAVGNGMRPDVWAEFVGRFQIPWIGEFYAATEGNANLVNNQNKLGAVGFISPVVQSSYPVKLVQYSVEDDRVVRDPDTRFCVACQPGETGELLGKIDNSDVTRRFDGYTDEAATQRKIIRDVFSPGDAWFRTGDLLRTDADGFVFFVDRIGDTFRWKGENVSTTEVAEVISRSGGDASVVVEEVAVYGVEVPGHEGRAGMACLSLSAGTNSDTMLTAPSDRQQPSKMWKSDELAANFDWPKLFDDLERHLPVFGRPLFFRVRESLSVTATFKHKKVELRQQGFDPSTVPGPLFFRDSDRMRFVELTPAVYDSITSGAVRL